MEFAPVASPLARLQARHEHGHVTTLLHTRWQIPGPLLDGSRDPESILAALVEEARSGRLPVTAIDGKAPDDEQLKASLKGMLDSFLEFLARAGLLLS
jgi:hypothetical protein